MENMLIGTQITKYRKAAGLTQEELGRSVGVSTQAVSRWECGGAPDISLLPAIADRLGVTVDALFGRERGENINIRDVLLGYFAGVPAGKTVDRLNRLVWDVISMIPFDVKQKEPIPYLNSCLLDNNGSDVLLTSNLLLEGGSYFGVSAEDMAFSVLCPRPEAGYGAYFADSESYRRLFALLAEPGCLELIAYMLRNRDILYVAEGIAPELKMEPEAVEKLLRQMAVCGLAEETRIQLPGKVTCAYHSLADCAYVPFLYLARCISQPSMAYYLNYDVDGCCLL